MCNAIKEHGSAYSLTFPHRVSREENNTITDGGSIDPKNDYTDFTAYTAYFYFTACSAFTSHTALSNTQ